MTTPAGSTRSGVRQIARSTLLRLRLFRIAPAAALRRIVAIRRSRGQSWKFPSRVSPASSLVCSATPMVGQVELERRALCSIIAGAASADAAFVISTLGMLISGDADCTRPCEGCESCNFRGSEFAQVRGPIMAQNVLGQRQFSLIKPRFLAGPEGVSKQLISLTFSWAKIRNLLVSFRMVPRRFTIETWLHRSAPASSNLDGCDTSSLACCV